MATQGEVIWAVFFVVFDMKIFHFKKWSAFEYEKEYGARLQTFFDSSLPLIRHPEVQEWGHDLATEREQMRSTRK
jgi:hypothetical protein